MSSWQCRIVDACIILWMEKHLSFMLQYIRLQWVFKLWQECYYVFKACFPELPWEPFYLHPSLSSCHCCQCTLPCSSSLNNHVRRNRFLIFFQRRPYCLKLLFPRSFALLTHEKIDSFLLNSTCTLETFICWQPKSFSFYGVFYNWDHPKSFKCQIT